MFKIMQNAIHRRLPVFLCALLLACTLLLNACSVGGQASTSGGVSQAASTARPVPSPTVSPTLREQGTAQLQTFQQWIALMQQYGGNVDNYQQQYTGDQQALNAATSDGAFQSALKALNGHVAAIKLPALKTEASSLQAQLRQAANDWNSQHTYYDNYDGVTYHLGYEYQDVVNYPAQGLLDSSATIADYQYIIEQLHIWLNNFQAYKTNFSDKTPYNQVHATDTQLMQKYGEMSGKVIVVSLSEQAMRVYQDGKLVNAFLVVTGMPDHPSLPGSWWVETRQTNIKFTSGKQPGQDGYYPPTPIPYAMQYHSGGYYLHESWWRTRYGPYKQFPHATDPGGTSFSERGSHGCVNMSHEDILWLYNFSQVDTTQIIIY